MNSVRLYSLVGRTLVQHKRCVAFAAAGCWPEFHLDWHSNNVPRGERRTGRWGAYRDFVLFAPRRVLAIVAISLSVLTRVLLLLVVRLVRAPCPAPE